LKKKRGKKDYGPREGRNQSHKSGKSATASEPQLVIHLKQEELAKHERKKSGKNSTAKAS